MKVATISLDQKWEDKPHNLTRCEEYLSLSKQHNTALVVFPEMTLTGFSTADISHAEDEDRSSSIQSFQELALKYDMAIMFGVCLNKDDSKATNVLICVDNKGRIVSKYTKIHPFSLALEDLNFISGKDLVITEIDRLKIGNSICYDLRFPELYRAYASEVNTMVVIANWPEIRVGHWEALLKARAIENICFMIGVNRTGNDANGIEYSSSSMIFNSNGNKCQPVYSYDEMAIYNIDTKSVAEHRSRFPALDDRKL